MRIAKTCSVFEAVAKGAVESNVRNPYSAVGQQFVLMRRNAYASKTKRDDVAMRKIIHTAAPHVAG